MNPPTGAIKLSILGLPKILSVDDLSSNTHLSTNLIYRLSKYPSKQYKIYKINKKNGGVRIISQPSMELKVLQSWILNNILYRLDVSNSCKGFIRNANIKENALPHRGAKYVLCLDIDDFFPSIRPNKVYTLFKTIGYKAFLSHIFTSLCTCNNGLPQGAPTSPMISNLVCINMDNRLGNYVGKRGVIYTRYADDMTFSSRNFASIYKSIPTIKEIIKTEGFELNSDKTRFFGPSVQHEITGLVVSENKIGIGRKKYRLIRSRLYKICQNENEITPAEIIRIRGLISYFNSVDQDALKRMSNYLVKLANRAPENKVIEYLNGECAKLVNREVDN